jgi:hypothetical protein
MSTVKKAKKLGFPEFLDSLGLPKFSSYRRLAESVAAAYSDCLPENVMPPKYSDYGTGRNLSYLAPDTVKLKDSAFLFKIIGQYNGFDPKTALHELIDVFGEEAEVRIAREGSPCVYIKATHNIWLGRRSKVDVITADEFSFDPEHGAFRVWWD